MTPIYLFRGAADLGPNAYLFLCPRHVCRCIEYTRVRAGLFILRESGGDHEVLDQRIIIPQLSGGLLRLWYRRERELHETDAE